MEQLQAWISTWLDPRVVGEAAMDWSGRIFAALVIFIVGRMLVRALTSGAAIGPRRAGLDDTLSRFLGNMLYIVLLIFVAMTAADTLGIETTSFLTILGAAGLAVGLALKDSPSNFSSGVMLVFFRPFKVGDFIEAAGVAAEARVAQHPAPEVAVQEVLPTAVTIAVRVWAQTSDYGSVRSDLLERIKRSLDKYGLSIAAAHRVVPPVQLIASK